MALPEENPSVNEEETSSAISTAKKRRLRRKKLQAARSLISDTDKNKEKFQKVANKTTMASKDDSEKSREEVIAARQAKKLAKQKVKRSGDEVSNNVNDIPSTSNGKNNVDSSKIPTKNEKAEAVEPQLKPDSTKSKDEVDRAIKAVKSENIVADVEKSKDAIKAERAAKKAAKQAKKKSNDNEKPGNDNSSNDKVPKDNDKSDNDTVLNDLTVREVVNTLKDIVNVAKEVQAVTDKVKAIDLHSKKPSEEPTKSKAELKAERRAKQEAQRAAKQAAQQQKAEVKAEIKKLPVKTQEEKPKAKVAEKQKVKSQTTQKMNWFQHLYTEQDKEALKQMTINSNLHPAVIKLGVQLASHVVMGSNARCIALLDALKKMVRDYSLPARTEVARGLEAALATAARFLAAARPPGAAHANALKHFRHHITTLPHDVDEFDAKKRLQEEIDRYIREQIDMAGEAISIAVRKKICDGDNILTYGCSSLVERILAEAQAAGVQFRAVVVGASGGAGGRGAREMLRRLLRRGVRAQYADISALSTLMRGVDKVVVGCASLMVNGAVLAAAGTLAAAQAARAHNVPLLVACETHKFADTVQTDAFVYNELGDPDDLIDKTDENSPIKDWRSNPNLTLLNLTYDVTPPSLVTAVVTELAVLPCTSAPVVVRYKMSEYGL